MTRKSFRFLKLASVLAVGGALIWVSAQSVGAQEEMGAGGRIITGAGQFRDQCEQCHGMSCKGDGPVANAMKVVPTDLTTLAKSNGGVFPEKRVFDSIKGTNGIAAHGTAGTPMPVWGLAFRQSTKSGAGASVTPEQVNKKIQLIVDYIKSIQQK
jgi:hypothetical protein